MVSKLAFFVAGFAVAASTVVYASPSINYSPIAPGDSTAGPFQIAIEAMTPTGGQFQGTLFTFRIVIHSDTVRTDSLVAEIEILGPVSPAPSDLRCRLAPTSPEPGHVLYSIQLTRSLAERAVFKFKPPWPARDGWWMKLSEFIP
jgi:hypothetical protein